MLGGGVWEEREGIKFYLMQPGVGGFWVKAQGSQPREHVEDSHTSRSGKTLRSRLTYVHWEEQGLVKGKGKRESLTGRGEAEQVRSPKSEGLGLLTTVPYILTGSLWQQSGECTELGWAQDQGGGTAAAVAGGHGFFDQGCGGGGGRIPDTCVEGEADRICLDERRGVSTAESTQR